MQSFKTMIKNNMRQYSMLLVLAAILVLFQVLTGGLLLTPLNLTNVVLQNSYIVILAIGMLPIIITARIDLSVGSTAAFVGAVAAVMMVNHGAGFVLTVVAGLVIGALVGAWQGFWVAYRNIPAFIVTLSTELVFRGLTVVVLDGRSIGPFSSTFQALSTSYLPDVFEVSGLHITSLIVAAIACVVVVVMELNNRKEEKKYGFTNTASWMSFVKMIIFCAAILGISYSFATYQGFPTVMIIMIALLILYSFITRRTIFGRHMYAVGGNEKAAGLSGVNIKKVLFGTFVNMGVLAGLAGLVFAARLNAGTPKAGNGFELDAIAACFIGGASVYGGTGSISGALIGCLIMGVMNNGMSIMGIAVDLQQAIKGLVILAAVAFDMYAKSKEN
jgi:putative multiple sugar transport system permease protein